jgi:hypothetical protein
MIQRHLGHLSLTIIPVWRRLLWITSLAAILIVQGCGSASREAGSTAAYPTGISEDIQQQLKYDARVDSFDAGESDLTVNVNDAWLNSPPGMQERSTGQWYSLWHSNHGGKVIVQNGGNKVASWSSDGGYKPEPKSKGQEK